MLVIATRRNDYCLEAVTLQVSRSQVRYDDEDEDEGPQPDQMLEQGAPIPVRLHNEFPPELSSTPLEDIDSFYHNQRVSGIDALISLTNSLRGSEFSRDAEYRSGVSNEQRTPTRTAVAGCSYFRTWLGNSVIASCNLFITAV